MSRIAGTAIIRVNGTEYDTEDGATLNIGGQEREFKTGNGRVQGFSESTVPAELSCSVRLKGDISPRELADITDATVLFFTDAGHQYMVRRAATSEPPEMDPNNANVSLRMQGEPAEEV